MITFSRYKILQNSEMEQALIIFMDNPLVGVGYNGYSEEKYLRGFDHRDSHNIVTSILVMGGIVGIIAFVALWITLIIPTIKCRGASVAPVALSVSMLLVSMKTGGVITYVLMWFIYAISYSWALSNTQGLSNDK